MAMQNRATVSDSGFSIIEILVSLVLVALILSALPSALRLGNSGLKFARATEGSSQTNAGLNLVGGRLAEAMPIFQHADDGLLSVQFKGGQHSISFIAPLLDDTSDSGLFRYTLADVAAADGGKTVELALRPFRADADSGVDKEKRTLLRNGSLSLRYFGDAGDGQGPRWSAEWVRKDGLPNMVELTLKSTAQRHGPETRVVELRLQDLR